MGETGELTEKEAFRRANLSYLGLVESQLAMRIRRMAAWAEAAQHGGCGPVALACYNTAERGRSDLRKLHLERERILRG